MPDAAERLESSAPSVISSGGALSGRTHARRMRIEGHRGRRAAALAGAAPHAVDDLHVPAVQAVEVAERQHRLVPPGRRVVGKVGDRACGHPQSAGPQLGTLVTSFHHQPIIGQRHLRRQAARRSRRAADRGTCA